MLDLPLLSALVAAFALTLYVLLDGFDLGVGALLLLNPDERQRDRMVASIAPTWDGNETWLIMAGVALLAAFPLAYGVLLPAFYLPLIVMLLSLGLRGVSFEFRFQTEAWRPFWDALFSIGSIAAALAQGLIVGGLLQGVAVDGDRFSGGVLDVFSPIGAATALAVLSGHVLLGAGWLHLKATGDLRAFAEAMLRRAAPAFALLAALACVWAAATVPAVGEAWARFETPLAGLSVAALGLIVALLRSVGSAPDGRPFLLGLATYAVCLGGLALVIFPYVVPFRFDLWAAASPTLSHVFLLVGAAVVGPVVLAYTAFAYRVFRGKTPETGWEA